MGMSGVSSSRASEGGMSSFGSSGGCTGSTVSRVESNGRWPVSVSFSGLPGTQAIRSAKPADSQGDAPDSKVEVEDSDSAPPESEAPQEPKLCINEFMADNETSYSPDQESWPDWIELYNEGPGAVELEGWSIIDGAEAPEAYVFPAGLSIAEGAFLLLLADEMEGELHLPFSLKATGEEILLFNPEGMRVDWVDFGDQLKDISAARVVDGSEEDGWAYVPGGTPGRSNQ